jgi:hypothetical protein
MTIVDGSGQLHPAKVARVVATFPQSACRTSTSAPGLALRGRVRVPPDPTTGPYYLRVRYRTSAPAKLPVFVDYGSGFGGAPEELLVVTPTSRESLVWLGAGSPHGVQLTSPASYVCVQGMDIIALAAAS